jgi:hypothetical protein
MAGGIGFRHTVGIDTPDLQYLSTLIYKLAAAGKIFVECGESDAKTCCSWNQPTAYSPPALDCQVYGVRTEDSLTFLDHGPGRDNAGLGFHSG